MTVIEAVPTCVLVPAVSAQKRSSLYRYFLPARIFRFRSCFAVPVMKKVPFESRPHLPAQASVLFLFETETSESNAKPAGVTRTGSCETISPRQVPFVPVEVIVQLTSKANETSLMKFTGDVVIVTLLHLQSFAGGGGGGGGAEAGPLRSPGRSLMQSGETRSRWVAGEPPFAGYGPVVLNVNAAFPPGGILRSRNPKALLVRNVDLAPGGAVTPMIVTPVAAWKPMQSIGRSAAVSVSV